MTIFPFNTFERDPSFERAVKRKLIEIINEINAGGGGGEINTASNLGSGQGIFASKSGVNLNLKSLVAGSNISLTASDTTITISSTGGGGGSGNSYFPNGW